MRHDDIARGRRHMVGPATPRQENGRRREGGASGSRSAPCADTGPAARAPTKAPTVAMRACGRCGGTGRTGTPGAPSLHWAATRPCGRQGEAGADSIRPGHGGFPPEAGYEDASPSLSASAPLRACREGRSMQVQAPAPAWTGPAARALVRGTPADGPLAGLRPGRPGNPRARELPEEAFTVKQNRPGAPPLDPRKRQRTQDS